MYIYRYIGDCCQQDFTMMMNQSCFPKNGALLWDLSNTDVGYRRPTDVGIQATRGGVYQPGRFSGALDNDGQSSCFKGAIPKMNSCLPPVCLPVFEMFQVYTDRDTTSFQPHFKRFLVQHCFIPFRTSCSFGAGEWPAGFQTLVARWSPRRRNHYEK